jgi:hypothetical protein
MSTGLRGIKSQKTVLFIITVVRISDPIFELLQTEREMKIQKNRNNKKRKETEKKKGRMKELST